MTLTIFILTSFSPLIESPTPRLSKTDLLTAGSEKSWPITSMARDERCNSSSDDQLRISQANPESGGTITIEFRKD